MIQSQIILDQTIPRMSVQILIVYNSFEEFNNFLTLCTLKSNCFSLRSDMINGSLGIFFLQSFLIEMQ